jgi:hypothetical protein
VKISAIKAEEEGSMLDDSSSKNNGKVHKKPTQTLGKETLNVELWASGQIEATPYGTFARIMNKNNKGGQHQNQSMESNPDAKSATLRSHIVFDHYDYPKGKAAIDKEMPLGKRIHPAAVYSDPARVFGHLTPAAIEQIKSIKPPENRKISNVF